MRRRHEGDIHELRTDAIHPRARVGETATGPAHVAGTAIEFDLFPHDPMGHAPLSDAEWANRVAVRMRARWGLRHKLAWAPRLEHDARRRPQHRDQVGQNQIGRPVGPVQGRSLQ